MTSVSKAEASSDLHTCHFCEVSVASAANHESSLQHRAARELAAAALDRWIAYMGAIAGPYDKPDEDEKESDFEPGVFCDACAEALPSTALSRHLTTKAHLVAALKEQVFDELARQYIDEENLKLLEDQEEVTAILADYDQHDMSKVDRKYTCHICALEIPVILKRYHYNSSYHQVRMALAKTAARRTSAFLHSATPKGVDSKTNIKYTELLKAYTGIDLMKKDDVEEEVTEKDTEEKASQSEIKKRLTAKQYFNDILPYLQYTDALYTLIIDDTEFVTIKINNKYMRVHVANFNGLYNTGGDGNYKMNCMMCHGYNSYAAYSSENDDDKLHVMSLGHIRNLLMPIDNVHGIRKIDSVNTICVLCNRYLPYNGVENHILNDIHHTAFLAEALRRGKDFKESKDDLKIFIYLPSSVDTSNFFKRHPALPWKGSFAHNNVGFGQSGNVNVCYPQGGNFMQGGNPSAGQGTLFGASSNTAFGGNTASIEGFGASPANTNVMVASPATGIFAASNANAGLFGASSAKTGGFGATSANTSGFGASSANTGVFGASSANTGVFGASSANTCVFGASSAKTNAFGASSANTGGSSANTGGFGASSANTFGFGASSSNTGVSSANTGGFGASSANTNRFGANSSNSGISSANTGGFGASSANTYGFGGSSANTGVSSANTGGFGGFGASPANTGATGLAQTNAFGSTPADKGAFGANKPSGTGTSMGLFGGAVQTAKINEKEGESEYVIELS